MATINDRDHHYLRAEHLLTEGERTVENIRKSIKKGDHVAADNYGKKAMGIWAQAQVHATLAAVPVDGDR